MYSIVYSYNKAREKKIITKIYLQYLLKKIHIYVNLCKSNLYCSRANCRLFLRRLFFSSLGQ